MEKAIGVGALLLGRDSCLYKVLKISSGFAQAIQVGNEGRALHHFLGVAVSRNQLGAHPPDRIFIADIRERDIVASRGAYLTAIDRWDAMTLQVDALSNQFIAAAVKRETEFLKALRGELS